MTNISVLMNFVQTL